MTTQTHLRMRISATGGHSAVAHGRRRPSRDRVLDDRKDLDMSASPTWVLSRALQAFAVEIANLTLLANWG